MVLIDRNAPQALAIGHIAPEFAPLPATDGQPYGSQQLRQGRTGLVLVFTCNHCPYAAAYEERLITLAETFQPQGIAFAAINSNDAERYPADNFAAMQVRAQERGFPFPYLHDASQAVAHSFYAVCTPHVFVLNHAGILVYRGRIDDNWRDPQAVKHPDLATALTQLCNGEAISTPITHPMGCSIKWKPEPAERG